MNFRPWPPTSSEKNCKQLTNIDNKSGVFNEEVKNSELEKKGKKQMKPHKIEDV